MPTIQQRRMQSTTPAGPPKSSETIGTTEQDAVVDLEGKGIVELAPVEDVIPAYETSGAPGTGLFVCIARWRFILVQLTDI
jgi:hypothetical protein